MVNVRHVNASCLLSNCFLSLLLGTNEQYGATVCNGGLYCFVSLVDEFE